MSDDDHGEEMNPHSEDLATRLFAISIAGVLSFIGIVFAFIILD